MRHLPAAVVVLLALFGAGTTRAAPVTFAVIGDFGKMVLNHFPPYSPYVVRAVVRRWPFKEWGATHVMCGHDHHYQRLEVDGLTYLSSSATSASAGPTRGRFTAATGASCS